MKLFILCLDDNLSTLHQPLNAIFATMLKNGSVPELIGGTSATFTVDGFGDKALKVEISSNSQNDPEKVVQEINEDFHARNYDIVLVDDNWGKFGKTAGQSQLLSRALSAISGVCPELPVFVLFTEHWAQTDRVKMFCDIMARYPEEQRRVTGLHKNDTSGLMLLIQRVVTEKRIAEERQRLAEENERLQIELAKSYRPANMVGNAASMLEVYRKIEQVSWSPATVLLRGESGTGKDLLARAIHDASHRKGKPFVTIDCGAIPEALLESDLFGHEKGAFTGAYKQKKGKFEEAGDGTVFLDEIGNLSPLLQAKLLRVLQNSEFVRVGGTQTLKTNARIIAATNRNLEALMKSGDFREDLFYRINVFPIEVPPLRERREDIPALVEHFVKKSPSQNGQSCPSVSSAAMSLLVANPWPGNVRELENCITRAVLVRSTSEISPVNIPDEVKRPSGGSSDQDWCPDGLDKEKAGKAWKILDECEVIASSKGSMTHADLAKKWGITRPAVTQKIQALREEMRALLEHSPNTYRWLNARGSIRTWKGFA